MPRCSGKAKVKNGDLSELDKYLAADTEETTDALRWWYERRAMFPALSRMALNYLTIPGASCVCFPRRSVR